MKENFVWSLDQTKMIRVSAVSRFELTERDNEFFVDAYGQFGGAVTIFRSSSKGSCVVFLDMLTT